ncbi:MAG: TatD family hydrolase, partial [Rhodospirillaceae bacterium]|nr:TatD family hydrolase [Rhodospirillaceae bacterium]
MYVDSHCHLDYHERDGDLDEVVARAGRAGVGTLVTICTKMGNFETVRSIAERYD